MRALKLPEVTKNDIRYKAKIFQKLLAIMQLGPLIN